MKTVKVKKLSPTAQLPTYGTPDSAGMDLYADLVGSGYGEGYITIKPNETVMIGTGLAFQPPRGYFSLIFARSGTAVKKGLAPANKVPVIDEDYRGEVKIHLHNHSDKECIIEHKERIAQIVFMPYEQFNLNEGELDDTVRGSGGFGSTGS